MEEHKFKDIKVGDEVLVQKRLSYGWRNELSFWVRRKVSRLTPTQFEVDGELYRKSNGRIVKKDSWDSVKSLSDPESPRDQTEYFEATKVKFESIKTIKELYGAFSKAPILTLCEFDQSKFENLINALNQFEWTGE